MEVTHPTGRNTLDISYFYIEDIEISKKGEGFRKYWNSASLRKYIPNNV